VEVAPGFVWEDEVGEHVVACGDAADRAFLERLLRRVEGPPSLVLADPPYALASDEVIRLEGHKDMFLNEAWDRLDEPALRALLERLTASAAAVAPGGNVWVWTSDWWISDLKRMLRAAELKVWPSYVWAKSNPPHSIRKRCVVSACEFLVMSGGEGAYFDLAALPKQRNWFVSAPDGEFFPAVCPWWVERPVVHAAERLRRDALKPKGEFLNRAQKPLDVTTDLIRAGAPEGGLVLDLCGGTGTALVAADRAGRRCLYVDLDPVQVRAAAARLVKDRRERCPR